MEQTNKKQIRFITNPVSGAKSKKNLESLINFNLNKDIFDFELCYTQHSGHAVELSREAADAGYFAVVAVGGDGTINEIGEGLSGTKTALGVVPFGSGNGFAYHIGIRRDITKAIQLLNKCHISKIDTGTANGRFFINVAGLGLDATVAFKTKFNKKRGFIPYFINTLKESINFKYLRLKIITEEKSWEGEYAMAVVANGSVYGYDFTIAPLASLNDAKFDVVLVKKMPVFKYFFLIPRMLSKSIHKSKIVEYFKTADIHIENMDGGYFHVDGEGFESSDAIHFQINPSSLYLLSSPN
jgi:YegS/Rv2252/BmrU family lipid kinase